MAFHITILLLVTILIVKGTANVLTRRSTSYVSPRITEGPSDLRVIVYNVATFVCRVQGTVTPTIRWTKNGWPISEHGQRVNVVEMPGGSVLRVDSVGTGGDSGTYQCVAETDGGWSETAEAYLRVFYRRVPPGFPVILDGPRVDTVELGRDAVMRCAAEGDPKPLLWWLKDKVPLNMSDSGYSISPSGSLHIEAITQSDKGIYECVAENTVGTVHSGWGGGYLYVVVRRIPPHFTDVPESRVEVPPGGAVNLTCVAEGRPTPTMLWKQGSEELTNGNEAPVGEITLQLTDIQTSAVYACVASSSSGTVESTTEVEVVEIK